MYMYIYKCTHLRIYIYIIHIFIDIFYVCYTHSYTYVNYTSYVSGIVLSDLHISTHFYPYNNFRLY